MRALLAVLLMLMVAFAGCADKKDNDGDSDSSSSTSGSGTGSGTKSGTGTSSGTKSGTSSGSTSQTGTGSGSNHAPSIAITLATGQSANGSAPLTVTFVLNGTDADNDPLSWTIAFGDGSTNVTGTILPAQSNHTYTAVGRYVANITVTDGKATTKANYTINALSGGGGGVPAPIVFSGSSTNLGLLGCMGPMFLDVEYHYFDAALAGVWKYKVEPSSMTTEWWAGDSGNGDGGAEGVIPGGSDNVAVCPAPPAPTPEDYTLTLYHPDYVL